MGTKGSIFQRIGRALGLADPVGGIEDSSAPKQVTLHVESIGTSGTEIYGGYYSEEYLSNLRGPRVADIWDQMRRSDPKIKMILSAVKNPIKGAQWTVRPGVAGDSDSTQQAKLIEKILFKDLEQTWTQTLTEILTFLDFGFSPFEVIHKVVTNDPEFGSYNSLAKLAFRSPKTIERWNLDPMTGKLVSISQYAYGDLQRLVDIPAEFLLVFTNEKEGDNYEGVSALRPCYGPWKRKNAFLKLLAVGMEKYAVPTPYMDVPEGKEGTQEFSNAKTVLEKYVSHQQQYILKPKGWDLGFSQTNFDASKIRDAIDKENSEMAFAFLQNFLELGQNGSGSYALSNDLSDFYLTGLVQIADLVCQTINQKLIPELVKLNFGPQEIYPELVCSGIKDKPGKELAEIIKFLCDAKAITPDSELENDIREKYGFPDKVEGLASPPSPVAPTANPQLHSHIHSLKLADKSPKTPRALMSQKAGDLRSLMQQMLGDIGKNLISDLMTKKKSSSPSQYLNVTNQVQPRGNRDYKDQLKFFLADVAISAIDQARKEIPGGNKIKLAEKLASLKLVNNNTQGSFDSLPPGIQKKIQAQIGLLTTFQIQDLLKALYFQFNSSVDSTDSDTQLEADLNDKLDSFLEGAGIAAASGDSVSEIVNEGRSVFFFDPEVYAQIDSFTFTNGDPVSEICTDLAGTTVSKSDGTLDRYSPPLHHNCKSYLVPNLAGSNKPIDPTGLTPSSPDLEKYITLSEPLAPKYVAGEFALQSIEVSKKRAFTQAEALRIASQVTNMNSFYSVQENEFLYRISLLDPSLLEEGSLKTFEPLEGVTVYYGRFK